MNPKYKELGIPILLCLTLGLAPFFPEPHLWSKLRWVSGGAVGMEAIDWFDLFYHGAPWIYLIYKVIIVVKKA